MRHPQVEERSPADGEGASREPEPLSLPLSPSTASTSSTSAVALRPVPQAQRPASLEPAAQPDPGGRGHAGHTWRECRHVCGKEKAPSLEQEVPERGVHRGARSDQRRTGGEVCDHATGRSSRSRPEDHRCLPAPERHPSVCGHQPGERHQKGSPHPLRVGAEARVLCQSRAR